MKHLQDGNLAASPRPRQRRAVRSGALPVVTAPARPFQLIRSGLGAPARPTEVGAEAEFLLLASSAPRSWPVPMEQHAWFFLWPDPARDEVGWLNTSADKGDARAVEHISWLTTAHLLARLVTSRLLFLHNGCDRERLEALLRRACALQEQSQPGNVPLLIPLLDALDDLSHLTVCDYPDPRLVMKHAKKPPSPAPTLRVESGLP